LPEPHAIASRRSSEPAGEVAPAVAAEAAQPNESDVATSPSAPAAEPADAVVLPVPDVPEPERKQRKLLLRKDLLKQCKRIARAQDRKLYQVVEAALVEYIQRHGAHE
jgi:hypothetical protein